MFWRLLFPLIFVYTLVDGLISNLTYPAKWPYLYKDILILVAYFFFAINERMWDWMNELRERMGRQAWYAAMGFVTLSFLQIFNPLSPGLVLGLLGFKVLFLYWPLALLAYVYMDRLDRLTFFMKMIAYLSIPINIFGMIQFTRGPELLLDIYGPEAHVAMDMAFLGEVQQVKSFLRVIGTFASSGQYGYFLVANAVFCFILFFSRLPFWERLVLIGIQTLNFMALMASGSRHNFVILLMSIALFFVLCKQARTSIISALIAALCLYGGFKIMGSNVVARYETLRKYEDVKKRTLEVTGKMFVDYLERYPMGRGLGSASTAATHLGKVEASTWELIENYLTKLQAETGLAGIILFYLFIGMLLLRWWDVWLRQTAAAYYVPMVAISCYCFSVFFVQGIFFILDAPPIPIFLWTMVGTAARISTFREGEGSA